MKKDSSARKLDMPQPARSEKVYDKNGEDRETTVPPPAMLPCATITDVLGTRCAHGPTHGRLHVGGQGVRGGSCIVHDKRNAAYGLDETR